MSADVDWDDMVGRYLEGSLTEEEQQTLVARLEKDPDLAERLTGLLEFEDLLDRTAKGSRSPHAFLSALQTRMDAPGRKGTAVMARKIRESAHRRRSVRGFLWPAIAAAGLLAIVSYVMMSEPGSTEDPKSNVTATALDPSLSEQKEPAEVPEKSEAPEPPEEHPGAIARFHEIHGIVHVRSDDNSERSARQGEAVIARDEIETQGPDSRAVLMYPDGTRIEIGPETRIRKLVAELKKRLYVGQGTVSADVAAQPSSQPMTFETPHALATVLGTTLRLVVDPDRKKGTRLEVTEGAVKFRREYKRSVVTVEAGNYAVAAHGIDLEVRPLGK